MKGDPEDNTDIICAIDKCDGNRWLIMADVYGQFMLMVWMTHDSNEWDYNDALPWMIRLENGVTWSSVKSDIW